MDKNSVEIIYEKAKFFHEIYAEALSQGEVPADISFEQLLLWERSYKTNKGGINKRLRLYQNNSHNIEIQCGLEWSDSLAEVISLYEQTSWAVCDSRTDVAHPYRILLIPFQSWVTDNTRKQDLLSAPMLESAKEFFIDFVLDELERVANDCFHEFYSELIEAHEFEEYSSFIDWFLRDGYQRFFTTYAALARLLMITSSKWVEKIAYFTEVFNADYLDIKDAFLIGDERRIEQISLISGLGHSNAGHNLLIQFDSGTKILFKPKSANTDLIYERLVQWINNSGITNKLMAYKVIDRDKHSWHEYVSIEPIDKLSDCHKYYQRIGTITALLQACGARDYHFENVRAHGDHPICTDHESILSHLYVVGDDSRYFGDIAIAKGIHNSIALSGVLTSYLHGIYQDPPSIDGVFNDRDPYDVYVYSLDDELHPIKTVVSTERVGQNIPIVNNQRVDPQDYISDIAKGYEECVGIIKEHSSELKRLIQDATNNWNIKTRILIRPSPYYAALLKQSLSAKNLKSGIDRSFYFEEIATFYFDEKNIDDSQYLLNTELASLMNFHSPWFHNDVGESVFTKGESGYFRSSAQQVFIGHMNHIEQVEQSVLMEQFHHVVKTQSGTSVDIDGQLKIIIDNILFSYQHYFELEDRSLESLKSYYRIEKGMGIAVLMAAAYKVYHDDKYADGVKLFLAPLMQYFKKEELDNSILDYLNLIEVLGVPLGLVQQPNTTMDELCESIEMRLDSDDRIVRIMLLKRLANRQKELNKKSDFSILLNDYHQSLQSKISAEANEFTIDWSLAHGMSGDLIEDELLNRILLKESMDYSRLYRVSQERNIGSKSDSILYGTGGFIDALILLDKEHTLREKLTAHLHSRLAFSGKFSLNPYYHDLSFLTGVSGVVYQYLRLLHPTAIPSIFLD